MTVRLTARVGSRIVHDSQLEAAAVVGSDPACDVVIDEGTVSRRHLKLEPVDGAVQLEDLGSTNGTRVQGARVSQHRLALPCVLLMGDVELRLEVSKPVRLGELASISPVMIEALEALSRAASLETHVVIEAAAGCDELGAARSVHALSPRARRPFEVLSGAALIRETAGLELFGKAERAGALERASSGTLFFTEVSALPLVMQPLLWRALERGEVRRSTDVAAHRIDTRIIASSRTNLDTEVEAGRFDADLRTCLAATRVRLPSLHERPDDIPLLLRRTLDRLGRKTCGFAPSRETVMTLQAFRWPVNDHELDAVADHALRLTAEPGPLDGEALGLSPGTPLDRQVHESRAARERVRAELERDFLVHLLARFDGDASAVAREAGTERTAVAALVKKHRISGLAPLRA